MAFIALIMIVCSEVPPEPPPELVWCICRLDYQEVCIGMELMGKDECVTFFSDRDLFDRDIKIMRERWNCLKDAPLLHEANRFPEREECWRCMAFNHEFRNYVQDKRELELDRWGIYDKILRENAFLYNVYDIAYDAKNTNKTIVDRRNSLACLKLLLTEDEWNTGTLPPCVPLWRFNESNR